MQAFKSEDVAINLGAAVVGCADPSLAVLFLSCGTTQQTKPLCNIPPAELQALGLGGLDSLKAALRQWMTQVEPVEQSLRAAAAANTD